MSMLNQQFPADVVDGDGAEALHHALAEEKGSFWLDTTEAFTFFRIKSPILTSRRVTSVRFREAAVGYPVIFLAA